MKRVAQKMNRVIKGVDPITDCSRYTISCYMISVLHVVCTFIFFYLQCLPLVVFNVLGAVFYLFIMKRQIRKGRYVTCFYLVYIAFLLNSIFTCIVIGWTFGFSLYNLVLIPISFYMAYVTTGFRDGVRVAFYAGILNLLCTLAVRIYVYLNGAIYVYSSKEALALSAFNTTVCFMTAGFFSFLYILEIKNAEDILKRKNSELLSLANFDSLTKLYNRRHMHKHLDHAIEKSKEFNEKFCVALGDIDDFKIINDTYGHMCGDMVLVNISQIMQSEIHGDNMVCRWGGEEFLILAKQEWNECNMLIERVREKIARMECIYEGKRVKVTVTFGIEEYKGDLTLEELIRRADNNLYIGKQKGKNCVV